MGDIADRIMEIINDNRLNYSSFSAKIGVSPVSVRKAALGESKPSYEFLASIAVNFPNINLNWLVAGVGPKHISDVKAEAYVSLKEIIRLVQENEKDLKKASSFLNMVTQWAKENLVLDSILEEIVALREQIKELKKSNGS